MLVGHRTHVRLQQPDTYTHPGQLGHEMPLSDSNYPPPPAIVLTDTDGDHRDTRELGSAEDGRAHDSDSDFEYESEMALGRAALNGSARSRYAVDKSDGGLRSHPLFRALTTKRIAIAAAALIALIYIFGGSSGSNAVSAVSDKLAVHGDKGAARPTKAADIPAARLPPGSPQTQKSGKCTPPPGKKEKSYALMIDAGSTGSRLHLYTFSHCDPSPGALPKLEDEGFFTTQPGLSSYSGKPLEAAESLRGLMDHAVRGVPDSEMSCTPVAVKATAGLRLLGEREAGEILEEVEDWLRREFKFKVVEPEGVVIMDGRDEGVYAWITINYLLGLIGSREASPSESAAIMDLGGASTQIVFEPSFDPAVHGQSLLPGDHVYDLDFAGQKHVLYQHSHLGYGLMQARRAVNNLVAFQHVWLNSVVHGGASAERIDWDHLTEKDVIHNPCMFAGERKAVDLDPPGRKKVRVTMMGTGRGFEACRRVVEVMLAKDAKCENPPCAFAGVYQPSLGEVFQAGKVWA